MERQTEAEKETDTERETESDRKTERDRDTERHTLRASLSGTFLHTARFSYATEGALSISAQLSNDEVSALRKVSVLIRLWKQPSALART